MKEQGYYIENSTGEYWQSVFPEDEAEFSQLHTTIDDAYYYIVEVGLNVKEVIIIPYTN